jgi:hypothetical protein
MLSVLDPRTGQGVRITVPENLPGKRNTGTIVALEPTEHRCDDRRPVRPAVTAFDPHYGNRSDSSTRASSDFDEMLWATAPTTLTTRYCEPAGAPPILTTPPTSADT